MTADEIMRINAGKWRGRNILTVNGMETRPTPDVVKQALFNIIGNKVVNSSFCDLFAGTGSVAFEALSRGAKHAVLVESGRAALEVISKNAAAYGCSDDITVIPRDVFLALRSMRGRSFDFVFFDPPYNNSLEKATLEGIRDNGIMAENGTVIVQFDAKNTKAVDVPSGYEVIDEHRYGRNSILFLHIKKENEQ